jgi:Major capsid protein Gp23
MGYREMTMSELYTIEEVPIKCGGMSLIGVGRERPTSWGNYFWLDNNGEQIRVLNMWWENLEYADIYFNLGGKVLIRKYVDTTKTPLKYDGIAYALIIDTRIPPDWYYNKLCFTGCYPPLFPILKDMYEYLGDPTNELEQFTDPVSYYAKRGGEYKNGCIIYRPKGNSTPTLANYKGVDTQDAGSFYCPFIPEKMEVAAPRRELKATYTMEIQQPLKSVFGVDAEEEIAKDLIKEIQKEIGLKMVKEINEGAIRGPAPLTDDQRRDRLLEICDEAIKLYDGDT